MYDKECDFIVKVAETDITKIVSKWSVKEVDDGMSSCNITIVNIDMLFSGLFQLDGDIEVMFGTPNDLSNTAKLKIQGVTETYSDKALTIEILGQDIIANIDGKSMKGMYKEGTDAVKAIKETVEAAVDNKASVKVDLQSPDFGNGVKLPCNGTVWSIIGELTNMCKTTSQYNAEQTMFNIGEFKAPSCAPKAMCMTGTALNSGVGREEKNGKKPDGGKGGAAGAAAGAAAGSGGGAGSGGVAGAAAGAAAGGDLTYDYGSSSDTNSVDNNRANAAQNASKGKSVRGDVVLYWSPELRAKKGIEFDNLGPENSGGWYVQTCTHGWEEGHGGSTTLHVMRNEPDEKQEGNKKGSSVKQGMNSSVART
jgi:hypothetical protein